jgi:hypothetical protein
MVLQLKVNLTEHLWALVPQLIEEFKDKCPEAVAADAVDVADFWVPWVVL